MTFGAFPVPNDFCTIVPLTSYKRRLFWLVFVADSFYSISISQVTLTLLLNKNIISRWDFPTSHPPWSQKKYEKESEDFLEEVIREPSMDIKICGKFVMLI